MISPSTTKKITTAIAKTVVYSSRTRAPCSVTATGGYSPVTNAWPAPDTTATAARTTSTSAATTTDRVDERRVRGELDINVLEGKCARGRSVTTDLSGRCRPSRAEPAPF